MTTAWRSSSQDGARPVRCLRGNVDVGRRTARLWNGHALGFEAVEMKRHCAFHLSLDFLPRATGRDATRKVRRVGGVAGSGAFDDDQVFHGFSPLDIIVPRRVRNTIAPHRHQSRRVAARVVLNLVTPSSERCKSFGISTFQGLPGWPWAQAVAGVATGTLAKVGSNPVSARPLFSFRGSSGVPCIARRRALSFVS